MLTRASRVLVEYVALVGLPVLGILVALQMGAWLEAPTPTVVAGGRTAAATGEFNLAWLLLSVAASPPERSGNRR
jgi:hypothetical protein